MIAQRQHKTDTVFKKPELSYVGALQHKNARIKNYSFNQPKTYTATQKNQNKNYKKPRNLANHYKGSMFSPNLDKVMKVYSINNKKCRKRKRNKNKVKKLVQFQAQVPQPETKIIPC